MNSLDNFEPFDDLEDWSDNVDLFMDAMANPPKHANALWELAKFKNKKAKAPEQSSKLIFDKPWIKEPEELTPTQSWLHWMNENALHVEMGIPLLAHPKHTYSKIGGLTDSESEYSSNSEDELDNLIQCSKQVESNSTNNSKSDQDSLPNLCNTARTDSAPKEDTRSQHFWLEANGPALPAEHPSRPVLKQTRPRNPRSLP